MKVRVKLFGTLPQRYPDYNPEHGLEVEIPIGAKVEVGIMVETPAAVLIADLLASLDPRNLEVAAELKK